MEHEQEREQEHEEEERERRIRVNGVWTATRAATVLDLLATLPVGSTRAGTAVAVNEALVRRRAWGDAELRDGDRVEVIHAVQGG